jgi:hypothetical protein
MREDLVQATCTFVGPKKQSQEKDQESWYGKPDCLLSQTLQKLERKDRQEKLVFKNTQNLNKIPGTLERKISLQTSK